MGLSKWQRWGVESGLTYGQVNCIWFGLPHAFAAKIGIAYEDYEGLKFDRMYSDFELGGRIPLALQINLKSRLHKLEGMIAGLSYEQVEPSWFQGPHARAAKKGIDYGLYSGLGSDAVQYGISMGMSRAEVAGLNRYKIYGMWYGLTRKQVNNIWFGHQHARAAKRGIEYEQYAGLDSDVVQYGILNGLSRSEAEALSAIQLQGMGACLTFEQVNHPWFCSRNVSAYHLKTVKEYSLPSFDIVKDVSVGDLVPAGRAYLNSQKVAFAMAFHPRLGADAVVPMKKLSSNPIRVIMNYLTPRLSY